MGYDARVRIQSLESTSISIPRDPHARDLLRRIRGDDPEVRTSAALELGRLHYTSQNSGDIIKDYGNPRGTTTRSRA
jgi:hypothetical protein